MRTLDRSGLSPDLIRFAAWRGGLRNHAFGSLPRWLAMVALFLLVPTTRSRAEGPGAAGPVTPHDSTLVTTMEAGEAEAERPRRRLVHWNEYDGPVSTFRFGYGFLVDFATYAQDDQAKQQVAPETDAGLRDFRLLFKGRFKTKRPFTWTMGVMYDGTDKSWRFRQTGFMVAVPELSGHLFVGRTKEGYSLIKIMVGYDGWTIERSTALDAFIPILADGVKWLGYAPKQHLLWNLGFYTDALSNRESFATYDNQVIARVGWLPILSEADGRLLHIAVMGRDAIPDEGELGPRSRPESFLSPYFVDTGKFPASRARTAGIEAYYRAGPWLFGTEYNFLKVHSQEARDPLFHGGDCVVSWLISGETRPYNTVGGYFKGISPARTVFEGGPGAWEAVLRFSYIDLDAGNEHGGKFWRLTPMVNWHLSDHLRLDLSYGYGVLDRFDLEGGTQFFQCRIQSTL